MAEWLTFFPCMVVYSSALPRCTVSGDPHVETFDGVRYRFGGECEHVLLHNCFEEDVAKFAVTLITKRSETNPDITSIKMVRILSSSEENGYVSCCSCVLNQFAILLDLVTLTLSFCKVSLLAIKPFV